MSDYLANVAARAGAPGQAAVRPRLASWFEPLAAASPLAEGGRGRGSR